MASIRKRGNSYQITVSKGRDIHNKQILETTTWVPDPEKTDRQNEKALQKFALDFEEKVKNGKYLKGEKMTYQEYIPLWLEEYGQKQLENTSLELCTDVLNRVVLPEIGHLKLSEIQPLHLQHLYSKLEKEGYTKNGQHKNYSHNTLKRYHQIISSTLTAAVQWQLIESNPCSRVKPPKTEDTDEVKCFTLEDAQAFLEQLEQPYRVIKRGRRKKDGSPSAEHIEVKTIPTQYKVLFHLALFGGLRRGELIALTWDDIDFTESTVTVNKSTARVKKGTIIKQPKSKTSKRTISLPAATMRLLRKYHIEQQEYRLSVGTYWIGTGNNIFIQDNGLPMDISTPNSVLKKVIKMHNDSSEVKLPDITLHGLRHTSATLLISENVNLKTVSSRLGHSEISTTMDIYSHALRKKDEEAAASIGDLFAKKNKIS